MEWAHEASPPSAPIRSSVQRARAFLIEDLTLAARSDYRPRTLLLDDERASQRRNDRRLEATDGPPWKLRRSAKHERSHSTAGKLTDKHDFRSAAANARIRLIDTGTQIELPARRLAAV